MKDACLSVGPVCLSSLVRGSGEQSPPPVCQKLLGIWHLGPHFVLIAALQAGTVLSEASEAHRDLGFGPQSHNWEEGEPGEDIRGGDGCPTACQQKACQAGLAKVHRADTAKDLATSTHHPGPSIHDSCLGTEKPCHQWQSNVSAQIISGQHLQQWGGGSGRHQLWLHNWASGSRGTIKDFGVRQIWALSLFSGVDLLKSLYFFESQKVRILPQKEALNIRMESAWRIVGAQ